MFVQLALIARDVRHTQKQKQKQNLQKIGVQVIHQSANELACGKLIGQKLKMLKLIIDLILRNQRYA